jgi:hypothetical protein
VASLPVMNLSLGTILTVEAIFSYVILGQDFAEELRAIRPTPRRDRGRCDRSRFAHLFIPWYMFASFRNHLVQKRDEMQRPNEMQRQPRTAELLQVFDSHAARIDFDPSRFRGGSVVVKFKPPLPPERMHLISRRNWFDRLPSDISSLLNPSRPASSSFPSHATTRCRGPLAVRCDSTSAQEGVPLSILRSVALANKNAREC